MQTEIIISGFGGQGTLYAGQLLTYTAMDEGKQVTWIPSYGPEMRGGTANCTVIVSDTEIGSPFVQYPTAVLAMNLPSLDKYESLVAPGGYLVVNASLGYREVVRKERSANLVLLGGLIANKPILPLEALFQALEAHTTERMKKFIPMNVEALKRGAAYKAS